MATVITWYIAVQLFAYASWPLAFGICNRLHDRGLALSKGLGLVLITYMVWALAHLGGNLPFMGFSFSTVSLSLYCLLAVSVVSVLTHWDDLKAFLPRNLRYLLTLEATMLAAFVAMVALKAEVPHISYHNTNVVRGAMVDHAAEKFTDFAVLNSLLTSSAFPPHDVWVAGETLNYYYFGHMMWAVLIKFCSVLPEVGFNLALATGFAITAALCLGLGYNLTRKLRWGLLALFLILLSSNADGFLQLVSAIKMAVLEWPNPDNWYVESPWWRNYSFWRSSRAVENTINEFPAFSYILGDLHAHVSALVIALCGWHVAVQIWQGVRRYSTLWRYEVNAFDELLLAAIICGALGASNTWDVPLYTGVVALALYCGQTGRRDPYAWIPPGDVIIIRLADAAQAIMVAALVALSGVFLLFAPFHKHFSAPTPPEGSLLRLVSPWNHSDPFEFFTHWAVLGIFPVMVGIVLARRKRFAAALDARPVANRPRAVALGLVVLMIMAVLVPLWNSWVAVLMLGFGLWMAKALVATHMPPRSRWLIGLLLLFCVMTVFCELFYVDDVFEGPIERINTVFKVYYGLWPLMAVATILALHLLLRWQSGPRRRRLVGTAAVGGLLLVGAPYAVLGTLDRLNSSTRLGHWPQADDAPVAVQPPPMMAPQARAKNVDEALNGFRYLKYVHPDDYSALLWARENIATTATLLEAAGSQYTYSGRFSTLTGIPGYAGWLTHSKGWRGSRFDNEMLKRIQTVADIYSTTDSVEALELLNVAGIDYVVMSEVERSEYPALYEAKFAEFAEPVFEQGGTAIWRVRHNAALPRVSR